MRIDFMRKYMLATILAAACGGFVAAGDWPQFRGPSGAAVSDEIGLPVKWGPKDNIRWQADLPGRGVSSPVVVGDRVYVTASSGYHESRLHVLCFAVADGKKLWERQFASTGQTMCHPKTCMAAPTPAADGKRVVALFATGDLAAFNPNGDLLWYRSLERDYPDITNQVGMAASPVLYKDVLLLPMENAGDSFAAGLDADTGKTLWRAPRSRDIDWVTPLVMEANGKAAAVFQTAQDLTAFDPLTGKALWTYAGENMGLIPSIPSPILGDGLIFVAGRNFMALKPADDGTTPEVVWKSPKLNSSYATALFHKGRVYGLVGVGVNCVNAKDGEVVWQQRIKGSFSASPVLADGKLYVVAEDGATTVIEVGDKPKVLATNALGETILATPAVAGGALFLRSDQHLWCIGAKK
jgi:outer membrane protein assembly factor BamB